MLSNGRMFLSNGRMLSNRRTPAFVVAIIAALTTACNKPPGVNPWVDDSIPSTHYGTASSDVVFSANVPPAVRVRNDFPQQPGPQVCYQVPHFPLWFEDSFADQGDNNDTFAWTWQDYFTMPYGLARFLLNTAASPVSMVVTPPGTPMVSDGNVGRVHDAARGESPNPKAEVSDLYRDVCSDMASAQPQGLTVEPKPADATPPQ